MAIYLPPLYCGYEARLKLIKDLMWNDLCISKNEECKVVDIIGWTYIISPIDSKGTIEHRMKNSIMSDYFEIIENGIKPWIEENKHLICEKTLKSLLVKDIKIHINKRESILIEKGKRYYCLKDRAEDGRIFWNLIEEETYDKTLRLKNEEFLENMEIF
ncbi:hypothetical protein M3201_03625 [Paenibacillus motobuensis]|uniref:hypothetical protein n=1 Tax=Paenibacillus TaxID=44249 RepID=UPI00203EBDF6|nr:MULTISPECIES: hypothetical protein [Paenibacillus]MCM3038790.1 hypothetical protein [Paenibacillus lutimineralis]MCM3645894.1 hypothetical protein [Paenibacillus motobuensis]